jgi:diacylglycerol O-acyltransferase
VIPLADGVPLAAGTLGWNGELCLSVTAEPDLLPEADDIEVRLARALDKLAADLDAESAASDGHDSEAPVWSPSSA